MRLGRRRKGGQEQDPKVEEARRQADEALDLIRKAKAVLDEEDVDPWTRELGMEAPPYNEPGEDAQE